MGRFLSGSERVVSAEEHFNNQEDRLIHSVDVIQPPSPATPAIAQYQG